MNVRVTSKISICIIVFIVLIISTKIIFHEPTIPIIYVAGNGSGDFNCDGKDDHVQINQALDYAAKNPGTTVHLKGPFTYVIDSPLLIGDNTVLQGDKSAVVKLTDEANWGSPWIPLIKNRDTGGNHDIIIQGFEIDGNGPNQTRLSEDQYGSGYYCLILFDLSYNITIQNMYMHNSCMDGARLTYKYTLTPSNKGNVKFANNTVYKIGHDALYCIGMNNIDAYNNDVFTRINSAFRLQNSNHAKIHDNNIHSEYTGDSTGPGIEIQRTGSKSVMDNIEIFSNTIHNLNGAGIWMGEGGDEDDIVKGNDVHIHHNIFYNVGQYWRDTGHSNAAIVVGQYNNTTIENNVIIDGGHAGIQTGPGPSHTQTLTTVVRNNIIANHDDHEAVGILNNDPAYNVFVSQNNCFYNNVGGSYKGTNIISSNDIETDPLFANITDHDYHLMSKAGR
ncbi:MAG: right-handed parallel beta-helix repeat-containing protein [Methanosarcina sp.]